jgi:type IV secretory pathway VirJ component
MYKKLIVNIVLLVNCIMVFSGQPDTVQYGLFGKVFVYHPVREPKAVALFVSGDGGWNKGVIDMAKNLLTEGALLVGIDIRHYYKNLKTQTAKCYYPASDFESLSLFLQKKYKLPQYLKPILMGYSSGATLVYGILAQAPANTFKGAIALGFCPDIETDKPLCKGNGLTWHVLKEGKSYYLEACKNLTAPFIVLQGTIDQVCPHKDVSLYMEGMHNGELVSLPGVGHGFSFQPRWLPQMKTSFNKIMASLSYAEQKSQQNALLHAQHLPPLPGNLPLSIIPTAIKDTMPIAFFISGDGGWTSFDQTLSEHLAEQGISIVGLDAQKYFWNQKTPDETTADASKILLHYMQQMKHNSFILIGYSFGADIVPFVAHKLSPELKKLLRGVYMLSPDEFTDFEIHVSDMLSFSLYKEQYDVAKEVKNISTLKPVCVFGDEEDLKTREVFSGQKVKTIVLPGSHHYNNDFLNLSAAIVKTVRE